MSAPDITKRQLNDAITALAKEQRQAAVTILAKYNVLTTASLPPEHWQAVHDACVEELARLKP